MSDTSAAQYKEYLKSLEIKTKLFTDSFTNLTGKLRNDLSSVYFFFLFRFLLVQSNI